MPKKAIKKAISSHIPITQIKIGDKIAGVYYLEQVFEKISKNGNKYTEVSLRDSSGSRFAKYWGVFEKTKKGDYVGVNLSGDEYIGNLSLIINAVKTVDPPSDLSDYISISSTIDSDRLKLNEIICKIGISVCQTVINSIFEKYMDEFINAPCSILPHYGIQGGLLKHTIAIVEIVKELSERYGFSEDENDIVITSALLHRVGAIKGYEIKDCSPVKTRLGILYGIENLSAILIDGEMDDDIRETEIYQRVIHSIISQHPDSYVKPQTKEAIVLAKSVVTDMEIVQSMDFVSNDVNENEEFTAYDPILKRHYYKGFLSGQ